MVWLMFSLWKLKSKSSINTWRQFLAIRIGLFVVILSILWSLGRLYDNFASAASIPSMKSSGGSGLDLEVTNPKRTRMPLDAIPGDTPTQEEFTQTSPPQNIPEPTNTPELFPTLEDPTATPTIELNLSPTPTSSESPPFATQTLTTTMLAPSATITGTASILTPTPTLSVTATATLDPVKINGLYVPDQVIVKFDDSLNAPDMEAIISPLGGKLLEEIPQLKYWLLQVPTGQVPNVLATLQSNSKVMVAEPNYIALIFSAPDDPDYTKQDYLTNIQAQHAWDITTGSSDVVIAIIDTGLEVDHPDLSSKISVNKGEDGFDNQGRDKRNNQVDDDNNGYIDDWQGWNAIDNNGELGDANGHGTHVAGIAAAEANNRQGIAGVSWGARLMPIKAFDKSGNGSYAQIAKALLFAARHRVQIINLSAGGTASSQLLKAAIDYADASGSLIIAAAGDTGSDQPTFPASLDPVIAVGAIDQQNKHADFSTYGKAIDLVAPGVKIYSTVPGRGYEARSGSSMAAAEVSGAAALLASLPQLHSPGSIRQALLSSAKDIGDPGVDSYFGAGLLQIYTALNLNSGTPTPTPTPTLIMGLSLALEAFSSLPTATIPANALTSTPRPNDPHVAYNPLTDSCAACHRPHSAIGSDLRGSWPEEQVCFACHTANNPFGATNIQLAFTSPPQNSNTAIYRHDVSMANGAHQIHENNPGSFASANRHIECEDCHEPHEATRGSASAPAIQLVMNAVSGVDPVWSAEGAPASYNWLPQASREYQICLKCHSSYTTLPNYIPDGWNGSALAANGLRKLTSTDPNQVLDHRDMAQEFNPTNASFHPLAAQGRNQSIPAASFVNGWSQTSLLYCSSCHNNPNSSTQGLGPHGSPLLHILLGSVNYTTIYGNRPASGENCFLCHSYSIYVTTSSTTNTNFRKGGDNLHRTHIDEGATCYTCHDTHGSEQLHLINFDTSAVTPLNGSNSQSAWVEITTGNGGGGCFLTCHNKIHNPLTYNR